MVMKNFRYTATDDKGKNVKGTVEATTRASAIRIVEQKNLRIIKLEEYSNIFTKLGNLSLGSVLSPQNLVFFLKQLGSLLNAGIKLVDCLEILGGQESKKQIKKIYMALQQEVYSGNKFSAALEMFPKEFPPLLISMTEVGEATGDLGNIIVRTSEYFDKQMKNNKKIMSVVKSPAVYIILTLVIVIAMSMFVFPNFEQTYKSFGNNQLPAPTQFFMWLSSFLLGNWIILLVGFFVFFITFSICKKKVPKFKRFLDKVVLKVPIFGPLIQMNNQMMIASTLAQLMSRGVNSMDSLRITKKVSKNSIYQKILEDTSQNVQDGRAFSLAFEESWAIDPIMSRMIATGEKTSEIPKLLTNLSIFYDETADSKVDKIKAVIQPILMLVVYGAVAALMLAMMLPSLSMTSGL